MNYKNPLFLILTLTLFSCSKDPESLIPHLDGYWQIEEVTLSEGVKKEYNFSDTIDYIEVTDNMSGFRKKLKPNLFGNYETSKSMETFELKIENDSLNIYYKTPYSAWKETILNANEKEMLIINANKDLYLYKHYEPIDIN
ncbi:lipocalin family protein [Sediminibacter sp. Hel_I_10]|uniref:lipocalin family protein n=1 Tax=Sediminibacter sp. Hel_I_10 TaxID=1392490 RepID=UPI00055D4568|nr:lipocalin family protein [Sediminibacter sp. Hel_I_10]